MLGTEIVFIADSPIQKYIHLSLNLSGDIWDLYWHSVLII